MTNTSLPFRDDQEKPIGRIGQYFDGIRFLWQRSETRFILKLMLLLLGAMLGTYSTLFLVILFFGETNLLIMLTLYVDPIFLGLFIFILIELVQLYRMDIRPEVTTSKNTTSASPNRYRRWIILLLAILIVPCYLIFLGREIFYYGFVDIIILFIEFHYWFGIGYLFFLYGLLFIIGFLAARGTMKSFEARQLHTFRVRPNLYFILLPIPWIILVLSYFFVPNFRFVYRLLGDVSVLFLNLWILFVYGFLCIAGIIVAFMPRRWGAYTVSQLSASLVFLFIILIPFLLDQVVFLIGSVVSLTALCIFYLQGTLDEYGDELRDFYAGWENMILQAKSLAESEKQALAQTRMRVRSQFDFSLYNPYRKVALGLTLLFLTLFGVIRVVGPIFSTLGLVAGISQIDSFLIIWDFCEMTGIGISVIAFTIIISFYKKLGSSN